MLSTGLSPVLAWFTVGLSIMALLIAVSARIVASRTYRSSRIRARLTALETELAEHADAVSKLTVLSKRQAAREAMRESRERKREEQHEMPIPEDMPPPGPGSTDLEKAEWKRQMRLKIARGELK